MNRLTILVIACSLAACTKPIDTIVPTSPDKMESIRPQVNKLSPEEKELFDNYLRDHSSIPDGLTIGKAITEEREYLKKKDLELKALQEQIRSLKEDWRFEVKIDKFTDEKKAFASIMALNDGERGFINVACFPSGIEVKVSTGKYIGDSKIYKDNVKYRIDDQTAVTTKMSPTSKEFVYENDKNSKFLKALMSGKKILVELTSYDFEISSASFSLNGAEAAIGKVLALCDNKK